MVVLKSYVFKLYKICNWKIKLPQQIMLAVTRLMCVHNADIIMLKFKFSNNTVYNKGYLD